MDRKLIFFYLGYLTDSRYLVIVDKINSKTNIQGGEIVILKTYISRLLVRTRIDLEKAYEEYFTNCE